MAGFYDVNAAIQKPNALGALQQGYAFGTQQRQVREEEQRQNQLRTLAPSIISGDPQAFEQAAAIDPQAAQQYQGAGDNQLRRLKGGMDYLKAAMESGNAARIAAAEAQVGPYVSRIAGKPWTPGSLTADPAAFEGAYARIAMLGQGGGGGVQSTYVDDAGQRVAIMRDGTTQILGRNDAGMANQTITVEGPDGRPRQFTFNKRTGGYEPAGAGQGEPMPMPAPQPAPQPAAMRTYTAQFAPGEEADPFAALPEQEQQLAMRLTEAGQQFTVQGGRVVPGGAAPQPGFGANGAPPANAQQPTPMPAPVSRPLPPINEIGGGPIRPLPGSGRDPFVGQSPAERAASEAEARARVEAQYAPQTAANIERAKLGVQGEFAPTQAQQAAEAARLEALAKSDAERQGERLGKQAAYQVFETAMSGLEQGLDGTSTGFFAGKLPAITEGQQVAEGGVAIMAPILKSLFRGAGEGTFTDKDQELLMAMVPTRNDLPAARDAKIAGIRAVVQAKMGVGASDATAAAPPRQDASAPQAGTVEDGYRFKGGNPADPANWEAL